MPVCRCSSCLRRSRSSASRARTGRSWPGPIAQRPCNRWARSRASCGRSRRTALRSRSSGSSRRRSEDGERSCRTMTSAAPAAWPESRSGPRARSPARVAAVVRGNAALRGDVHDQRTRRRGVSGGISRGHRRRARDARSPRRTACWSSQRRPRSTRPSRARPLRQRTGSNLALDAVVSDLLNAGHTEAARFVARRRRALPPVDSGRVTRWIDDLAAARGPLVDTVSEHLRGGGSWERTARSLGVHRNTVRSRIGMQRRSSDALFTDPDVSAALWLALRSS